MDEMLVPLFAPNKICSETSRALADPLRQYIQDNDFVAMLRLIFSAKLFHPIVDTYRYTRTYEQGLATAEYLMDTLAEHVLEITAAEWHNWMAHFLFLQLQMLDYLNQWEHYVACYDQFKQAIRSGQIDAQYDYLLFAYRYEIIKRKLQKKERWEKARQPFASPAGAVKSRGDRLSLPACYGITDSCSFHTEWLPLVLTLSSASYGRFGRWDSKLYTALIAALISSAVTA